MNPDGTLARGGPADDPDDTALLAAHIAGDPDAFGLLFTRHRDRLWAVALSTIGNPEEAADALQDAMVSAFRRADSFRGDSAVTTWLHRIVVNACLDRLRRRKVRAADPLPDDLEDHARRGALLTSTDPAADPEASALGRERRQLVLAALAGLPPEQRAALVLVDMEGWPVLEASTVLGVPTGTVKSRCARGRARLATLLADLDPVRRDGTHGGSDASQSGAPPDGPAPPARPPDAPPDRPPDRPPAAPRTPSAHETPAPAREGGERT